MRRRDLPGECKVPEAREREGSEKGAAGSGRRKAGQAQTERLRGKGEGRRRVSVAEESGGISRQAGAGSSDPNSKVAVGKIENRNTERHRRL